MVANRTVVGLLGLCAIVAAIAIRGGYVMVPSAEQAMLRGARAAVHGERDPGGGWLSVCGWATIALAIARHARGKQGDSP